MGCRTWKDRKYGNNNYIGHDKNITLGIAVDVGMFACCDLALPEMIMRRSLDCEVICMPEGMVSGQFQK